MSNLPGVQQSIDLLDRFPPTAVQAAAIRALSQLNQPGVAEALIARWRTSSPEARREILAALLSKKERIQPLLDALKKGQIMPGELDAVSRSNLLNHSEPSVRAQARSLFGEGRSAARLRAKPATRDPALLTRPKRQRQRLQNLLPSLPLQHRTAVAIQSR